MKIELHYFEACPNAGAARRLLVDCLARLGLPAAVDESEGDFPSPSILIDGEDVMGAPAAAGRACRLDVPTEGRLLEALRAKAGGLR